MKKLLVLLLFIPSAISFSFSKNTSKSIVKTYEIPHYSLINRTSSADSFITYWNEEFRPNNPAVCDITYEAYKPMYERYHELNKEDREILNETYDLLEPEYTIGHIVKVLVQRFYPNNKKVAANKKKLDQSAIIVIAVVVALVGATAISVLYILRNQKVIK